MAIALTNRNSGSGRYSWLSSNPEGYARWFDARVATVPQSIREAAKQTLFEGNRSLFGSVEQVPERLVRTPLQQAIQLLKRHRDVRFAGARCENGKPISMIITTLAACLYEGECDVYTALVNVVSKINMHAGLVDNRHHVIANQVLASRGLIRRTDEGWYIGNPVNPNENFADRWHENGHAKAKAFFNWVVQVQNDLLDLSGQRSVGDAIASASRLLLFPSGGLARITSAPNVKPEYPRVTISNPNRPWST